MKAFQSAGILLIFAAAFCGALPAQSTFASITGLVTDANGSVLPGVKIEATNIATNYKYTATSNDTGEYTVTGLLNGTYTVRAIQPGFAEFVAENVVLVERETRRLDIGLKVGTVETKVEVNANPQLIETETARISDVQEHEVMWIAPLFLHRTRTSSRWRPCQRTTLTATAWGAAATMNLR